jgi:hypothetical protein
MVGILSDSPIDIRVASDQKIKKRLDIVRSHELELSKRHPLGAAGLKQLSFVDLFLAMFFLRDGMPEEAWSLMEECNRSCESYLALHPGDREVERRRFEAAAWTVSTLSGSSNDQLHEIWNARALAALERLRWDDALHAHGVSGLSRAHRIRADSLLLQGETDRAKRELEADLAFVRSELATQTNRPEIVLSEVLALAALGRGSGELTVLPTPIHFQPPYSIADLDRDNGELMARRLGLYPSLLKSSGIIPEDLPPEAWVDRLMSLIETDAAKFHLNRARIPAAAWWLRAPFVNMAGHQRSFGTLGGAHRIVDRLFALAERLTRSYPDQAAAYMLLTEGYVQKAKNAYQEEEAPVIRRWEQKALDAAIRAETLDPENYEARNLVRICRARLNKLASK